MPYSYETVMIGSQLRRTYQQCKDNAKRRRIPFLLTFEQWLGIWQRSGRLQKRGRGKHAYVMARFNDSGPYAVGNVKIVTGKQNWEERVTTPETRAKLSAARKGKPHSPSHYANLVAAIRSPEVRAKNGAGNRGKHWFNDGIEEVFVYSQPSGFISGRLKHGL